MVKDDQKESTQKLLKNFEKIENSKGGKCSGCGYEASDNDLFKCEFCGASICTYCHNMTDDFEFICRACIKKKGLTSADLQFEEDGAGRPFF
jgi:hypothetical protein